MKALECVPFIRDDSSYFGGATHEPYVVLFLSDLRVPKGRPRAGTLSGLP